jgi:urease accessory protein
VTAIFDRRRTQEVGRHARLELVFASRGGRTVLAHAYAEPPFRAGRWFAEGDGLHMILASSAPGLFGGDALEQTIVIEAGARVRLTSQSAPQLHASADGATARLRSTFRVSESASLSCHWDPLIPFPASRLDQKTCVELAPGAELYWSDAMMSGRQASGEQWLFSSVAHELRISRAGVLEYLERFTLVPDGRRRPQHWTSGGAAYFGTAVVSGGEHNASEGVRLHTALAAIPDVHSAASCLSGSLMVIRLMAASGVPFQHARSLLQRRAGCHAVHPD